MVLETPLLVLILGEAGLRSSLVARLSLAGADVLTTESFDDLRLARHALRPLVLIADEAAVEKRDGGWERLIADPRWHRVLLLSPDAPETGDDPRLLRIARADAGPAIAKLLSEWRAG